MRLTCGTGSESTSGNRSQTVRRSRSSYPRVAPQFGCELRGVHDPVRSNPSWTRGNFDRTGSRLDEPVHPNGGLQHRSCVGHPFVNACKSIRSARRHKKQRRDDDLNDDGSDRAAPLLSNTGGIDGPGRTPTTRARQRPALEGELARTAAALRFPSPRGSHTAPYRVMRPTRPR